MSVVLRLSFLTLVFFKGTLRNKIPLRDFWCLFEIYTMVESENKPRKVPSGHYLSHIFGDKDQYAVLESNN